MNEPWKSSKKIMQHVGRYTSPGMMVHTYNLKIHEAAVEGRQVQGPPGKLSEILFQNTELIGGAGLRV